MILFFVLFVPIAILGALMGMDALEQRVYEPVTGANKGPQAT